MGHCGSMRRLLLAVVSTVVTYKYYFLFSIDLSATENRPQTMMPPQPPTEKKALNLPDVVQRSLTVPDDPYNITAALCHKSLFGDIDLWMVLDWVAYHRLLGFDRIFMSYVPSVKLRDGFEELASLPYLTLFENTDGIETIVDKNYHRLGATGASLNASYALKSDKACDTTFNAPHMMLEARCLDQDAHSFDWVMISDVDEYLWFKEKIGVKEFLHNQNEKLDYISFGKWMYTKQHKVNLESTTTGFHIDSLPFTLGVFCKLRGTSGKMKQICPKKNGRAKIMLKPSVHHGHVCIHGTHWPKKREGSTHISARDAHLMEWNGAALHSAINPTMREKKSFPIYTDEGAGIHPHTLMKYKKNNDSSVTMNYDDKLHTWLDFVASRGRSVEEK
jgi:hypothetical protein